VGRARKSDSGLPARVYAGRSAYEYRPREGGCIRLAPLAATPEEVHRAYALISTKPVRKGFAGLITDYKDSADFKKLAEQTKRAYVRYATQLIAVFGHMEPDDIEPRHIREWLDARAAGKSAVVANREFAMMGAVVRWGYERGRIATRPTIGVRRFVEQPRTRVVTADELEAFAAHAGPRLRAYLALRMATGLRQGELLALPLRALTQPDGLHVENPSKRGQRRIIEWSPALQTACDAVLHLEPRLRPFAWPAAGGGKLTQAGFQVEWQRVMRKHVEAGGERFHEHDLRAAAVEELDLDHAQRLLGHQRQATTARHYRRTPEKVKPAR